MCSFFAFAQKTISGKVNDDVGKPIASASVTVEEPGKDAIIAYGISNSKGEYKVTFTSAEANVDLKIKAFNQKSIVKTVKNESQTLNFSLQSDATEIKEVKLKTKLITKRGDTIAYDLKMFESKSDRVLADVLKKIPGIEVNKDGSILYQGEPINKFYVNGKDLMEGGYGTINNSLPKDAVQKVEVLENHQPVKILQDKIGSENAAINVKLKNKVTMTGRGELGAGFDPLLWNVKLTPMFFGQKNQWVVNYKANNNGETVEKEGMFFGINNRFEGRRSQAAQKNWINVESASTPNLPEKRYLMNNVHYFSANVLTNPFKNKDWELKANTNYSNNAIERKSSTTTNYAPSVYYPSGAKVVENFGNNFYSNTAKAELIFTKNAKKGFFKNTTTWNGFWDADRALAPFSNGTQISNQSLESPTFNFTNSLSTIVPYNDKLFNVTSYINYQTDKQNLYTDPAFYSGTAFASLDQLHQNVKLKTVEVNHSASVGYSYKKWTFTPEFGLNMNFNSMNSTLYGVKSNAENSLGLNYQNDFLWNEIQPYSQVGINYKSEAISFSMNLPMNFYAIDYQDNLRNKSREQAKTVFEPNMFLSYDFASFFKLWAFANVNYNYGNFGSVYDGILLRSARNLGIKDGEIPETLSKNIGSRFEYRNPLNNLFFNVRFNTGTSKNNLITSTTQTYDPVNQTIISNSSIILYDNSSTNQSEGAEIGKYFPKFKTNISTSFSNRDSNGFSLVNGNTSESKNNSQSFGFKINNAYFSWLSFDYNLSMNWNKNRNLFLNTEQKSSGWDHNLSVFVYPIANHTIGLNWDDISSKTTSASYRNSFYDLSYQYSWAKKKIDFELKWLNIANKKVYEITSVNTTLNSISTTSINIRPSQFMFTVKFNFK